MSKLTKVIPMEVLVKALWLYHFEKYSLHRLARELGYGAGILRRHMERKFNIKIKLRNYKENKLPDVNLVDVVGEQERKRLLEKLNKIIRQYDENMKVCLYELGNKEENRYDSLGVYKIKEKYDCHMLLIKQDGTKQKLSVAYRDILTKNIKILLT